jgi:two-component system response regulator RegA
MLTGYGDIPLAVAAVREGADTLLSKPVDADRLLREAAGLREAPRARGAGGSGAQRGLSPRSPRAWTWGEAAGCLNLEEMERETIRAALKQSGGVVASAARLLGIDRRTLQRKLKKIGA